MGGQATAESGRQLSGSEFTLSATAMSIQPRQPTQRYGFNVVLCDVTSRCVAAN